MNLPYLQVFIDDSRRYGDALAVKARGRGITCPLRLDPHWWRGVLEDVWDFGVKASGDRRPDGVIRGADAGELLCAAARYPGPADELAGLLADVDLLERTRGGLRVKGVAELYGPAWDRQNVRRERASKAAKARWNDASSIHRASPKHDHGNAKTEIETETEIEIDRDLRSRSAGASPRRPSWQQDAKAQFDQLRTARLAELQVAHVPDEQLDVAFINARLKPVLEALGGTDDPAIQERFSKLVNTWLNGKRPASADPPYPFRMFVAPHVWGPLLETLRGAA